MFSLASHCKIIRSPFIYGKDATRRAFARSKHITYLSLQLLSIPQDPEPAPSTEPWIKEKINSHNFPEDRSKIYHNYQQPWRSLQILLKLWLIGNRTSCRPIRSVIILVIKQIGLPLRSRPILLITCMITDQIGLHSVLLPLLIIWFNPCSTCNIVN